MTRAPFTPARRRLLVGTGAVLVALLASSPAHAQLAPVTASGDQVVTNAQTSTVPTLATRDGSRAELVVAGPVDGATLTLTANGFAVAASGNDATLTLAPAMTVAAMPRDTRLLAGTSGVEGTANLLIANSQDLKGGGAQADQFGVPFRIAIGSATDSSITLDANRSDVSARGNAAVSTIAVPYPGVGGAGLVSLQSAGGSAQTANEYDGVAARVRSGLRLETGPLSGTRVSVGGNRSTADAATNAADNSLTAPLGTVAATDPGPVMLAVPLAGVDPLTATLSILNRQQSSNVSKARAGYLIDFVYDGGPAIRSAIDGDVTASTVASDGNAIDATVRSNLATNRLSLTGTVTGGSGALGAIANVQSMSNARVVGSTHGGVGIEIAGKVGRSTISARGNEIGVDAAGNVATANRLTVDGAVTGDSSGVASASAGSVDAMFSVRNAQDYGAVGVTAISAGPAVRVAVANDATNASLNIADNAVSARATGDSAVNALAVGTSVFEGSAALVNVQGGSGNVVVSGGDAADRGGMAVEVGGSARDSVFAVIGNTVTGSATGTVADNRLDVTSARVAGTGAPGAVDAGASDYAATGTLALFNGQTLGGPNNGNGTPTISSTMMTRTGVDIAGVAAGSTLTIDSNTQRAMATGNAATNRTSLTSADADDAAVTLSSTQYGQTSLLSSTDIIFAAPLALDESALLVSGNADLATARINDVENALGLVGAGDTKAMPSSATVGTLGSAYANGQVVLANQQFATGSASAVAASRIADTPQGALDGSRVVIDGNRTAAESIGNRALNTISTAGSGAALASSQTSMARIDATTSSDLSGIGAAEGVGGSSVALTGNSSTASARGNVAENNMTITSLTGSAGMTVTADRYGASAAGAATLASAQSNYGAVSARAGDLVALNAGPVNGSSVTVTGNAMAASAYGNAAINSITTSPIAGASSIGLANVQVNYGPVTATVNGAGYRALTGTLSGSGLSISGNQISAVAVGNQASSAIVAPR